MRRAYRIDLGFDLFEASRSSAATRPAVPVEPALRPLAARLEALGVPLLERPYAALGAPLGLDEASVLAILARWCEQGTLRRLGVVLRHHEFGITANAMAVFAPPEEAVDAAGERLAAQPGVTLCYRRAGAARWPYTLYCMVHGRERAAVQRALDAATHAAGLDGVPREVLFSTRRYKQTGSRYFAESGVA
jgi:DNA-binding Lrp family transcriptional regulator